MATKKKSKLSAKQRSARTQYMQRIAMAGLAVIILIVAYLVVAGNRNAVEANLTAPRGTVTRSQQIDSSELKQESSLDSSYDSQRTLTAQSDSGALSDVGKVVQDAN